MQQDNAAVEIRKLNDAFRSTGTFTVTQGVLELNDVSGLLQAVRQDDKFSESNDPYGEHDFGVILWAGEKIFWKIDYYDQKLERWEDPLSPQCRRVLTVMLAEEY